MPCMASSPIAATARRLARFYCAHDTELWRSDGTLTGTKLFADLVPGYGDSNPHDFVATSDRLYFVDNIIGSNKQHLWKTDGTSVRLVDTVGTYNGFNDSIT